MTRESSIEYVNIQRKEFSALTCFDFPLFSLSLLTNQNPKTQVPFSSINSYIFLNQSKTHFLNYNWEFGTEENKEENERVGAHGREWQSFDFGCFVCSLRPAVLLLSPMLFVMF